MFAGFLLAVAFASTPQQAAVNVFGSQAAEVRVVRANVVGNFSLVQTQGGKLEGAEVTGPMLLQRFSFGWQPLGNDRCALTRVPKGDSAALEQGFSFPMTLHVCPNQNYRDVGPANDVTAVRKRMRGPFVPYVRISGNYALGEWYGAGGGESLYRKEKSGWTLVKSDGGAMSESDIEKYGVDPHDAQILTHPL